MNVTFTQHYYLHHQQGVFLIFNHSALPGSPLYIIGSIDAPNHFIATKLMLLLSQITSKIHTDIKKGKRQDTRVTESRDFYVFKKAYETVCCEIILSTLLSVSIISLSI